MFILVRHAKRTRAVISTVQRRLIVREWIREPNELRCSEDTESGNQTDVTLSAVAAMNHNTRAAQPETVIGCYLSVMGASQSVSSVLQTALSELPVTLWR